MLRNAKESNSFHYAQKYVHQTSKKISFLPCFEQVLFCAFEVQNRVQFAWAKNRGGHALDSRCWNHCFVGHKAQKEMGSFACAPNHHGQTQSRVSQ